MGIRFRKSIKIVPGLRLNLSKNGVGVSGGLRGARVGLSSRGIYKSVGIPGTGVYSSSYSSLSKKTKITPTSSRTSPAISTRIIKTKMGCGEGWLVFICLILLIINPIVSIVGVICSIAFYKLYLEKRNWFKTKKRLKNGLKAYKSGDYEVATRLLEESFKDYPNDKAIAYYAGDAFSEINQYQKAITLTQEYLVSAPTDTEVLKRLANWYIEIGDDDNALKILQSLSNDQIDAMILLKMAALLSRKDLNEAAIEVLKRAPITKRNLTSDLVEIIYALGLLYEQTGDKRRAKSSFERVYSYEATFRDVASKLV